MKVKALVAHENEYGVRDESAAYHKQAGTVYEIADEVDAQALIDAKIVQKHSSGSEAEARKPS